MTREEKIRMLDEKLESYMTQAFRQRIYSRQMACYKLAKQAISNADQPTPSRLSKRSDLYLIKDTIELLKKAGIPFESGYDPDRFRSRMKMYQHTFIIIKTS